MLVISLGMITSSAGVSTFICRDARNNLHLKGYVDIAAAIVVVQILALYMFLWALWHMS